MSGLPPQIADAPEPFRPRHEPLRPRHELACQVKIAEPFRPRNEPLLPRAEPAGPRVGPTRARAEPTGPRVGLAGPRVDARPSPDRASPPLIRSCGGINPPPEEERLHVPGAAGAPVIADSLGRFRPIDADEPCGFECSSGREVVRRDARPDLPDAAPRGLAKPGLVEDLPESAAAEIRPDGISPEPDAGNSDGRPLRAAPATGHESARMEDAQAEPAIVVQRLPEQILPGRGPSRPLEQAGERPGVAGPQDPRGDVLLAKAPAKSDGQPTPQPRLGAPEPTPDHGRDEQARES